jgi:hypothetical protein
MGDLRSLVSVGRLDEKYGNSGPNTGIGSLK